TLEDMIVAAINEVFRKVDAEQTSMMGKMAGGMGGLGGGLF
ncbi:MAG: YbaB/EbfC family nucleoid-associated protein, partial [Clostridia bacterium]|nr:YbaB/EbfC family nucleoid-associated protein [Clostridia bacterium]